MFKGINGITKEEMLTQMSDDIDALAEHLEQSREETIQELKDHYDGYHFCWPSPDVFNPYSLLNCFADGKLKAYWFGSGYDHTQERFRYYFKKWLVAMVVAWVTPNVVAQTMLIFVGRGGIFKTTSFFFCRSVTSLPRATAWLYTWV